MVSLTTTAMRNRMDDVIDRVVKNHEHVVLTRRGKSVAVLIPVEDLELLQTLCAEEEEDVKEAKKELASYSRDRKSIPWEKIKRENNL